jgi:PAS domain S-box-containing protein
MFRPERTPQGRIGIIALVAVSYFLSARLGLAFITLANHASPFWPAAGLALALTILEGPLAAIGIVLGAGLNAYLDQSSLGYALISALAATSGALAGGQVYRLVLNEAEPLAGYATQATLLVTSFIAAGISALVAGVSLYLTGRLDWSGIGSLLSVWMAGDIIGILVVAPLVLALRRANRLPTGALVRRMCWFVLMLGLMSLLLFFVLVAPQGKDWILLVFPAVLVAFVFGGELALLATVCFAAVCCVIAVRLGYRPFDDSHLQGSMFGVQVYLAALAVVSLILTGLGKLRWPSLATLLLLVGWSLSAWIYHEVYSAQHELERSRLTRQADRVQADLANRMQSYIDTLRSGAGLIAAMPDFSVADWRKYALSLDLPQRYPAMWGIGVVYPVEAPRIGEHAAMMSKQSGLDFQVHPVPAASLQGRLSSDPAGEKLFIISMVEPRERNLQALGLDLASEQNRRRAAIASRDSGEDRITRRIVLVQDEQTRPAFLLFHPVYRSGLVPPQVESRRGAFLGWVYSPILTETFFREAIAGTDGEVEFFLFEGAGRPEPANLLASSADEKRTGDFEEVRPIELAGETFTVGVRWRPGRQGGEGVGAVVTGASVALACTLLAGLVMSLQSFASRARSEADARTSEIRSANRELAANNRSLHEAQAHLIRKDAELTKLALVVSHTSNAVVITDARGCIEWINESFTRITGYTQPECHGLKPGTLLQGPGTSPESIARFRDNLRSGQGFRIEILNYRKGGREIWLSIEIQPLYDAKGTLVNFVGIESDITEERRAKAELESAREAAEAASRSKSAFLGNVSHELRTPLNVIIGSTEMVLRGRHGPVPEAQLRVLQRVREAGGLLLGLINELLDLTQAESGRVNLKFGPVEVAGFARDMVKLVEMEASDRHLSLHLTLSHQTPLILADSSRLKQVLVNLLGNALKFTPSGGRVDLMVSESADPAEIRFTVRDNGPGIAVADQERVFREFERVETDVRTKAGGTGLGLPIARRLVELHGGKLTLSSEPGKGCAFVVCLPVRVPDHGLGLAQDRMQSAPPIPVPTAGRLVLVAEDYPANLELITSYLESKGFRVATARNGREAFDQASAILPDIVLMDVKMPVLDGLEAIRMLRADPKTRSLPIVALTAFAYESDAARSLSAGADEYISKPIDFELLDRALQRCLDPQRPQRPSS